MNHQISSTIGEIVEAQGAALSISDLISQLKAKYPESELEEFYKELNFSDFEQAIKAIVNDIKG